jgi:hypothetical protein
VHSDAAAPIASTTSSALISTSTTPTTFFAFSNLPKEVQTIVFSWAALMTPPRVMHISKDPPHWFRADHQREIAKASLDSKLRILHKNGSPVPSLLHVCRESRRVALADYSLWDLAEPGTLMPSEFEAMVYVNEETDIFYFDRSGNYWFLDIIKLAYKHRRDTEEYKRFIAPSFSDYLDQTTFIQRLAINADDWAHLVESFQSAQWLKYFPSIKEVTVVVALQNTYGLPLSRRGKPDWSPLRATTTLRGEWIKIMQVYVQRHLNQFTNGGIGQQRVQGEVRADTFGFPEDEDSDSDASFLQNLGHPSHYVVGRPISLPVTCNCPTRLPYHNSECHYLSWSPRAPIVRHRAS